MKITLTRDVERWDETYDYRDLRSGDGRRWVRDLRDLAGFPDLDPARMSAEERDALAAYLRADDGSLSAEDQAFSEGVADEVANLPAVERQ